MKRKRVLCILLAALLLTALVPLSAAADDPSPTGRITLQLKAGAEIIPEYTVALYRIADYDGGDITLTADFAETALTLEQIVEGQKTGDTYTTLQTFLDEHPSLTPAYTGTSDTDGNVVFTQMPNGLYFVVGAPVEAVEDRYARKVTMTSFLVALPTMIEETQTFTEDVVVDCRPKVEIEHLKGPLKIVKTVLKWETTDDYGTGSDVTFVFSVKVTWQDFVDPTITHTRYNVAAITFSGTGTKEYLMPELYPVGAKAEVYEIYPIPGTTGPGTDAEGDYYLVSGPEWDDDIDTIRLVKEDGDPITTVRFSNTYNGGGNNGNGYLNESTYSQDDPDQPGSWTWTRVR